jgi:DNA-binding LacI/PurR family transcriptional regulator
VATPRYKIGERAAAIVLEIIRGTGARPRERTIDLGFRLIHRESSTAPRPRG